MNPVCRNCGRMPPCIVTKLRAGRPGFDSRQGQGISLFATTSILALRPTQPPIQWVTGAISPWVKRPGREADHSSPSTVEIKMSGAILSVPHMSSPRGASLITGTASPPPCYGTRRSTTVITKYHQRALC